MSRAFKDHLPQRLRREQGPLATPRWLGLSLWLAALAALAALWWPASAQAVRLKELASVQGVRPNTLVGYGLVVGLDGTGDQTTQAPFTTQSLTAMLQQMGITVPAGTGMQLRNVAAVMVTTVLPAFAQPGQAIDVSVASVGNAKSLRGGTLVATPLKGADGQIYAMAQGNLVVGGAGASAGGSKVQINHLSAGRVPEGAMVERAVPTAALQADAVMLALNAADYTTARSVVQAINKAKGEGSASAVDARSVRVRMPASTDERVSFLADIENLVITQAQPAARVVLNARTGSVVLNDAVTLGACAVAHGSLSVTISTTPQVSQPNALASGQTTVTDKSRHRHHPARRRADSVARRRETDGRGEGAEQPGRYADGPAGHFAGHEECRRAERGAGGYLMAVPSSLPSSRTQASGLAGDATALGALRAKAAKDPKAAIKEVAKQFETLFMQELLKSMRAAQLSSGMFENEGSKLGTEMLDAQYANQMSGGRGGLADAIARQLERQMQAPVALPALPKAAASALGTERSAASYKVPGTGAAQFVLAASGGSATGGGSHRHQGRVRAGPGGT